MVQHRYQLLGTLVLGTLLAGITNAQTAWQPEALLVHAHSGRSFADQREGDSLIQTHDQIFIASQGDAFDSQQACGRVAIYQREELSATGTEPMQILSREELGFDCSIADQFGSAMVQLKDGTLVIAAPESPKLAPNQPPPFGALYFYQRDELGQWLLSDVLEGNELNLPGLGRGLASDGERLFVFEQVQVRQTDFSTQRQEVQLKPAGISILARDDNDHWQYQQSIPLDAEQQRNLRGFLVNGDQVLIYHQSAASELSQFSVFTEFASETTDWLALQAEVQFTPPGQHPPALSIEPIAVSGDWMITRPRDSLLDDGSIRSSAAIYHRDGLGHWEFNQQIDLAQSAQALGIELPDSGIPSASALQHSAQLNGADLLISWAQQDGRFAFIHYRLDETEHFEPQQLITTIASVNGVSPFFDLSEQGLLIPNLEQTTRLFTRAEGRSYLINRSQTGSWWFGPQRIGQGLGLEILPGNRAQLLWLTHDDQGAQMWLAGSGQVQGDRIQLELFQPVGGGFGDAFDAAAVQRQAWGTAELIFSACDRAELNYQSASQGNGSLPVFRFTQVEGLGCHDAMASTRASRWTGSWFDPNHSGEGLMMHLAEGPNGPRLIVLWASFQADGRQAYFTAQMPFDERHPDSLNFATVQRPDGINFNGVGLIQSNPWGRFDLNNFSCNESQLSYTSRDPSFGSGQLNLLRYTYPTGLLCF